MNFFVFRRPTLHNGQNIGRYLGFYSQPSEEAFSKNGEAAVEWNETGQVLLVHIHTREKIGLGINAPKWTQYSHTIDRCQTMCIAQYSHMVLYFQSCAYIFQECYIDLYFLYLDKSGSATATYTWITKIAKTWSKWFFLSQTYFLILFNFNLDSLDLWIAPPSWYSRIRASLCFPLLSSSTWEQCEDPVTGCSFWVPQSAFCQHVFCSRSI